MPVVSERGAVRKWTGTRDVAAALVLHAIVFGGIAGAGWWSGRHEAKWGDTTAQAGAVQATMVSSLPLPPRVQPRADNVLASETPSVAPPEKKAAVTPPPEPKAVPVPEKVPPRKAAPQPVYSSPKVVPPPKNPPNRVTSGESGGVRIAMQAVKNAVGTSAINVTDQSFGARFGYYVRAMNQKISQQWSTQTLDAKAQGLRVYLTFRIDRQGVPGDVRIVQSSGDRALDQSAVRALERIDTLGPLPQAYSGSYIDVQYYFEPAAQ